MSLNFSIAQLADWFTTSNAIHLAYRILTMDHMNNSRLIAMTIMPPIKP